MLESIALVFGGSLTSGINMYMTIAGLGIAGRMHWISLPGDMGVFSNPLVIAAALVMYVIEFVADKIPFVDSAWDSVHTFIRPLGGAAIGYCAAAGAGAGAQAALGVLTGAVALNSHLTKATSRAAINSVPTGIGNAVASVTEDSFVLMMLWFIIKHPIITLLIATVFIIVSIWFLRMMFRFLKKVFTGVRRGDENNSSRNP